MSRLKDFKRTLNELRTKAPSSVRSYIQTRRALNWLDEMGALDLEDDEGISKIEVGLHLNKEFSLYRQDEQGEWRKIFIHANGTAGVAGAAIHEKPTDLFASLLGEPSLPEPLHLWDACYSLAADRYAPLEGE